METPMTAQRHVGSALALCGYLWVGIGCCCTSWPTKSRDGTEGNAEVIVISWLKKVPFRDTNPQHRAPGQTAPPSYDDWLREGKRIRGVKPVLIKLLNSRDRRTDPAQVAHALGRLGDKSSVPPLVNALRDEDMWVRTEAAASLGRIGDPAAVDALCRVATEDDDHNVRANAVLALGSFQGAKVREYLERALRDKHGFVRKLAARSLRKVNSATQP